MKILLYRGNSLISKAIRWQTRSVYSHAAVQLDNGTVVEAWHVGGVRHNPTMGAVHTPGTTVDVFDIEGEYDSVAVSKFLLAQVGKKYDFYDIARFMSRRDAPADDKWFCSELAHRAFHVGGLDLLSRIPSSHVSPRDLALSPVLKTAGQMVT